MAKTPSFFNWSPPKPTFPAVQKSKGILAAPAPTYPGVIAGAGGQQPNTNTPAGTPLTDEFGNPVTPPAADPNANPNGGNSSGAGAADKYGKGIAAIQLLDQLHQNYMQQIDLANKRAQESKDIGARKAGSSAVVRGAGATEGYRQQLQDLVTQLMNAQQSNALRAGAYNTSYNAKRAADTEAVNAAAPAAGMPTRSLNE